MRWLVLKSMGKELKSNWGLYKGWSFILISLVDNKKWM